MSRAFELFNIAFTLLIIVLLSLVALGGIEDSNWKKMCRDAGGIPAAKEKICINPGAVIEVN